ncbi:Y-family DNA polymerase, partial [Dyella sp.]|uniref:Y-family DNA polymerase n=1 Tax=Dyella sp. TaxID=1869338 RepID=UPI002ED56FFD
KHHVVAFSSNYTLYGDLSARCMRLIGQWVPPEDQEVYSIDETFLDFTHQPRLDMTTTGQAIRERVRQWTGLPVCVGIGETKTLAKLANHVAKRRPEWNSVCDFTAAAPATRDALMGDIAVTEVWGVGHRVGRRLGEQGVLTVAQLRAADPKRIHEQFGVVMERTVRELRGEPCLGLDQPEPKQQIVASRSFGAPVYGVDELAESVREFMARAVRKLRLQGGVAGAVGVWIETNRFRPQDAQYYPSATVALPVHTDDVAALTYAAQRVLRTIYRRGYRYVKSGVMLLDLRDKTVEQGDLFDGLPSPATAPRERLLDVLDRANARWGRGTIGLGNAGMQGVRRWAMHRGNLTPAYSTRWSELREVR